jgi:hypothetical protein
MEFIFHNSYVTHNLAVCIQKYTIIIKFTIGIHRLNFFAQGYYSIIIVPVIALQQPSHRQRERHCNFIVLKEEFEDTKEVITKTEGETENGHGWHRTQDTDQKQTKHKTQRQTARLCVTYEL